MTEPRGVRTAQSALRAICQSLVTIEISPGSTEKVHLEEAAGRVLAEDIYACFDTPLFDESTRDGYAIGSCCKDVVSKENVFKVVGSSGAGDSLDIALGEDEAWRVMTGGKLPVNCARVIPLEWCREEDGDIVVGGGRLTGPTFIRRKGDLQSRGDLLLGKHALVTPGNLIQIADGGHEQIGVYSQPKTCFCCTGKELVNAGNVPDEGKKISSNQYLLHSLFKECSCNSTNYGLVADEEQRVVDFFNYSLNAGYDLVVTTGGTGGGDFDLVERCFVLAGGTVVCNSIRMRPGKSLVAGFKGRTVYLGLPGPPAAVHTVFLEMVAPVIRKMRGENNCYATPLSAVAAEDIRLNPDSELRIKEGVIQSVDGTLFVQIAGKKDFATCNILVPPGKGSILKGEVVEIHMRVPLH